LLGFAHHGFILLPYFLYIPNSPKRGTCAKLRSSKSGRTILELKSNYGGCLIEAFPAFTSKQSEINPLYQQPR
jgi:hypothetical protein